MIVSSPRLSVTQIAFEVGLLIMIMFSNLEHQQMEGRLVIPNNANIYISWENTQVSFLVNTESDKVANDFIEQYLLTDKSSDSGEYAMAAEYYFYLSKDLDRALTLINKAIARKNESWYYRQKVDILEKQRKYKEAIDCANLASSLDQKRMEWDIKSKQQSSEEYKQRIEIFKSQLKK